jgi:hypothetical protein
VNGEDYLRVFLNGGNGTRGHGPTGAAMADHCGLNWALDPTWFAEDDRLRLAGESTVAGRAAVLLEKPPRGRKRATYPRLGWRGFDDTEYALAVDAERGILLRISERQRGRDFRVIEVDDVRFDIRLRASLFDVSGAGFDVSDESQVLPQDARPEDAARRLGFPLFVPGKLPFRPYFPKGLESLAPGAVTSMYYPAEGIFALGYAKRLPATRQFTSALTWMQARKPVEKAADDWDSSHRGGLEFRMREVKGSDGRPWIQAQVEKEGTWILALGDLDREQMMQLVVDAQRVTP